MSKERGASLIELVLVIAIIGFLVLIINSIPSSIANINRSRHISQARDVASKKLESLRKQGYSSLASGTGSFSDPALSSLPSSSTTYTIEDCPSSVCTNSEHVKQITAVVYWKEGQENKNVSLVTLVGEGGLEQ